MNDPKIKIVAREVLSDNWYTLNKITYDYTGPSGEVARYDREVYERGNGSVILLYNKAQGTVVLTRQFRMPTFVNGNDTGMLIEACAGLLEQNNAEDAIKRETEEETGYKISKVQKIFESYMSPGSVTEILHFFVAEYEKEMKVGEGGGVDDGEDIQVLELPFTEAVRQMETGEIKDGKTIMLLQYAQIHKLLE